MSNEEKTITAFLTKKCLSTGKIEESQVEEYHSLGDPSKPVQMVFKPSFIDDQGRTVSGKMFYGNDWHRTREEAVVQANTMRDRKIKLHEKSIAALKKLEFK
jgi:hypothetical protein